MAFKIASSPFTRQRNSTRRIMLHVLAACLPGFFALSYFFGWGTLIQILLACLVALLCEAGIVALRKQPVGERLADFSAILTAVLLGLSLPPLAPWWIAVIATLSAIGIAKQLYGGLGQNPFNPAMVGYVIVLISFPVQMTSWLPDSAFLPHTASLTQSLALIFTGHDANGLDLQQFRQGYDGLTQATPLDNFKTHSRLGQDAATILRQPVYDGWLAGFAWQWVNIAFLAGGVFMLWRKVIDWRIPAGCLAGLILCATLAWWWAPLSELPPATELFSGSTMLGAFFIATDPVTAATTSRGRLIYGALIGGLCWLIRTFGGYPEGMAFAVLLANLCVPLIDHYTQPRAYGHD
ncbi:electron transport complex subunit RsxD [Martelella alba]|uniref:Ion-translocating oxidoreductase complex subunit D n=1 Tax=Martelella alba TaxID=2590451 RepID=A0ABY2SJK7_9HYPH|nr:electron transport complex subunit RsxD [Martelella alba]TKI05659.1 electron transport complex subunit RsxD [Martelella alba]